MALATFGRHYTQAQLFALQALDTRPAVVGPNNVVLRWGNPYTNFVGLVDGLESNITGYGVYWPVILQIARPTASPPRGAATGYQRRRSTRRSRPVTRSRFGSRPALCDRPPAPGSRGMDGRSPTRSMNTRSRSPG